MSQTLDTIIAQLSLGEFTVWVHGVTGAIFLFTIMVIQKQKFVFKEFLNTFYLGIQRSIVWAALFIAFQEDNPTIAITIASFSSVISILVFSRFFHEKITPRVLTLAMFGIVGCLFISLKNLDNFTFSRGAILALMILPLASTGPYLVRKTQVKVPVKKSAMYMYLWVAILLSFTYPFFPKNILIGTHEIVLIAILTITGAGGHILYNYAQVHTSYILSILVSNIHTVSTAIFAYIILGRTLNIHQIIGVIITLSVVGFVSFYHGRDKYVLETIDI